MIDYQELSTGVIYYNPDSNVSGLEFSPELKPTEFTINSIGQISEHFIDINKNLPQDGKVLTKLKLAGNLSTGGLSALNILMSLEEEGIVKASITGVTETLATRVIIAATLTGATLTFSP